MADTPSRTSGRVNIESNVHEFYEQLTKGTNPHSAPFRTMKDLFMMAACAGFQIGQRRPLTGKKHQPFHYTVFSEQIDIPILKAIAIAATDDIEILGDFDNIVAIAEEYANAGILEIRAHVVDQAGDPLWNLVEAIR